MFILFALILGIVAGLRALTALAAVSWAAKLGLLSVAGTPLAFMGFRYTAVILTVLAIAELITDKLPSTPSRKVPAQFAVRVLSGCLVGASVGAGSGSLVLGLLAGAVGAVIGTVGGAAARARLAAAFGKDLPAALLEDAVAVLVAVLIVTRF